MTHTALTSAAPRATAPSTLSDPTTTSLDGSLRIAAVGDLHLSDRPQAWEEARALVRAAAREADVLVLCGDLTTHGRVRDIEPLLGAVRASPLAVVAVLGNHDHESDCDPQITMALREAGVAVLDGEATAVRAVGFAGVKGFGGGFGRGAVESFGERELKAFLEATEAEAVKLDTALMSLRTDVTVVVMHYSPALDTLAGEPEYLWPFLGSSRFAPVLERHRVDVAFHGHAHLGSPQGRTPGGVPVFNVALPVLSRSGRRFRLWTSPALASNGSSTSSSRA